MTARVPGWPPAPGGHHRGDRSGGDVIAAPDPVTLSLTLSTPSRDPDRPADEPGPPGPATSDASLRAALDRERTHAQELLQLAESQKRLLRRRSVRIALALDTRARRARQRAGVHARRARRRSARVQLATLALRARWVRSRRADALDEVVRRLPPPPTEHRATTVVVIADSGHASIPECDVDDVQIIVVLAPGGEPPVGRDDVEVIRATHKTPAAAARDAIARTTGDLVALTRSSSVPLEPGWLARLTAAVQGDTVAAVPMLVHPTRSALWATPHDLLVRSIGLDIVGDDDLAVVGGGCGDPARPVAARPGGGRRVERGSAGPARRLRRGRGPGPHRRPRRRPRRPLRTAPCRRLEGGRRARVGGRRPPPACRR